MSDRVRDIEVLHGSPSAEEVAAVVVALTPVGAAPARGDSAAAGGRTPAWTRAALLEHVGGMVARAPTDLSPPR